MSDNKMSFEGNISMNYRNKEILKTVIILMIIAASLLSVYIIILVFEPDFTLIIALYLILYSIILPDVVVIIISFLYLTAYVRKFTFRIFENEININHGVFTQIRATIPYSRIQNINITTGVFDRMVKTYTVKIETAGSAAAAASAQKGVARPEGYIPGLKDPNLIENKVKEMMTKYSAIPSGLEDKIFKPEELAFDNFISYVLSKMREGEGLKTEIKALREKEKLSMAQLAEKISVPIQTIDYLEQGKYNPSLTLALKIADVLNCKIEDLFKMK